jgi:uncharacterized surface protein with fasciclin (FAS1) repeats
VLLFEEIFVNFFRCIVLAAATGAAASTPCFCDELVAAELAVEVGGAPMVASKTIVENFAASKDHETFIALIENSGLVETLRGEGPFTVFAPIDSAFDKLPKEFVATLLEPEKKSERAAFLGYHVVAGRLSAADLVAAVQRAGGKSTLRTLQGEELVVAHDGRKLEIFDAKGGEAIVTIPDVNQKNGVVHVVDRVLQPRN